MELSTYFRINSAGTGQFERTLIVAEEGALCSYLEGMYRSYAGWKSIACCSGRNLCASGCAGEIQYLYKNWYPGWQGGQGWNLHFVKRGLCYGKHSKISWTQVETGSAITWKYPSVILKGDIPSRVYSVAVTNNFQQADTGTKMIHLGKNTRVQLFQKEFPAEKSE